MSALGQKQTLRNVGLMSALPPKADINYRERDVGFVPLCSVDNLASNKEGAHERSLCSTTKRSKKFNLPAGGPDRLHKKSIFCTKSFPLMGLYVQSHVAIIKVRVLRGNALYEFRF